jgi:hypothetical protein
MVVAVAVLLARWQAHMHAHPEKGEVSLKGRPGDRGGVRGRVK